MSVVENRWFGGRGVLITDFFSVLSFYVCCLCERISVNCDDIVKSANVHADRMGRRPHHSIRTGLLWPQFTDGSGAKVLLSFRCLAVWGLLG